MSKGILDHATDEAQVSMSTVGRVVIIAGILLAVINFGIEYGLDALNMSGRWAQQLKLGLFLFFMWLAVSSGLRTIDKLLPGIAVGWLLIAGMGIGLWSQAVFSLAKWAVPRFTGEEHLPLLLFLWPGLLSSLAVSLLVAVLTTITLRVESKLWSTLLRILIFGLLALLIYLWM